MEITFAMQRCFPGKLFPHPWQSEPLKYNFN